MMDQITESVGPVGGGAATRADGGAPDTELVARVRAGDLRAFEQIMRRHNTRLYRVARSIVKDAAESEDVVQETYVRAYEKLESFIGPNGFGAWLARIAANEALMRLRRRRPFRPLALPFSEEPQEDDESLMRQLQSHLPDPEQLAANGEVRRMLETAIDALPDGFRAVFVLRAVEEMSVDETAAVLGIKPQTVKTRFHRARALLREALSTQLMDATSGVFAFAGTRCDRIVATVLRRLGSAPPR